MTEIDRLAASLGIRTGIFPGVSWEEYSKWPGVSITRLHAIDHSPKRYRHRLAHPRDSAAMSLGRTAHVALLEPERFASDVVVWDAVTDSGNAAPRRGKAWEAFKALHSTRDIVTSDEYESAKAIAGALRADDRVMRYLCEGAPEVSMQWIGPDGRACRGRMDWLTKDAIVGLKTTRDIRTPFFGKQAVNYGWHGQWAFYGDGYRELTGNVMRMVEIVVESEAPYDVAVYTIEDDVLDIGRDEYARWLGRLAACEETERWPGAMPGETRLELPAWAYPAEDSYDDETIPMREDEE